MKRKVRCFQAKPVDTTDADLLPTPVQLAISAVQLEARHAFTTPKIFFLNVYQALVMLSGIFCWAGDARCALCVKNYADTMQGCLRDANMLEQRCPFLQVDTQVVGPTESGTHRARKQRRKLQLHEG